MASRCLNETVKDVFCVIQGFSVLRGRQAGEPPMGYQVKRTTIKTQRKYSKHGRGTCNLEKGLREGVM